MTDPVTAVVLGVIEGITEFLPVSSTGHLLIAQQWLPRQTDLFNVVIQTGAVLAVIPLFHKRFHQFIFNWRDSAVRDYFVKIVAAFVITGAGGFIMEKKGFKLPEKLLPIAIALLVGGVIFLIVESWLAKKTGHGAGQDQGRRGHTQHHMDRGHRGRDWTTHRGWISGSVPIRDDYHICIAPGADSPARNGVFVSSQHSDDAGGGRLQDF